MRRGFGRRRRPQTSEEIPGMDPGELQKVTEAGLAPVPLEHREIPGVPAQLAVVGRGVEDDGETEWWVIRAERAFLRELNVRPSDPVAVHGSFEDETLVLEALLGDAISGAILRDDLDGDPSEEGDLGVRLAKLFMADSARDYLAGYR